MHRAWCARLLRAGTQPASPSPSQHPALSPQKARPALPQQSCQSSSPHASPLCSYTVGTINKLPTGSLAQHSCLPSLLPSWSTSSPSIPRPRLGTAVSTVGCWAVRGWLVWLGPLVRTEASGQREGTGPGLSRKKPAPGPLPMDSSALAAHHPCLETASAPRGARELLGEAGPRPRVLPKAQVGVGRRTTPGTQPSRDTPEGTQLPQYKRL